MATMQTASNATSFDFFAATYAVAQKTQQTQTQ